jgi:hypothetical protein
MLNGRSFRQPAHLPLAQPPYCRLPARDWRNQGGFIVGRETFSSGKILAVPRQSDGASERSERRKIGDQSFPKYRLADSALFALDSCVGPSGRLAGRGKEKDVELTHRSATNRSHGTTRLVALTELMVLRFGGDRTFQDFLDATLAGAQRAD